MSTVAEPLARAADDGDVFLEAPALLRVIWADPQYMAEHLAVWSLVHFGPRASRAVERIPPGDRSARERVAIARQTRVAMTEGAFVGGPFILLIPVAFCAALLAQAQLVYELAVVAGRDARDQMRASELLVLLGAHDSVAEANAALDTMAHDPGDRQGKRLPRGSRWQMVKRMAYLVGVFTVADPTRSRLRNIMGWVGIGALFLVGIVLPLAWVPYMTYSTRRATLRLADRSLDYYAGDVGDAGVIIRRRRTVRIGGTAAFARTALVVLLPLVAGVVALLTGAKLEGGRWVSALLFLLIVSAAATAAWLGYRWWRHRRRHADVD